MEDLVARIDTPRLNSLDVTFFHQLIFDAPQFVQFIGRAQNWNAPEAAVLTFYDGAVRVTLPPRTFAHGELNLGVSCSPSDWQLDSLAQVCSSSLPPLPTVENLYVHKPQHMEQNWQDDIEITQWLELFHPFTTVKNLYLSEDFASRIATFLQELARGRMTEALPALQNLFVEGLQPSGRVHESIGKFVAARQLFGHPIAVSRWERHW
jgi:hypothetical protein